MFLSNKSWANALMRAFLLVGFALLLDSCASAPKKKPVPISELIKLDMKKSEDLLQDFQKKVHHSNQPEVQSYLTKLAQFIAKQEYGFETRTVEVRILQDSSAQPGRFYAFPGTTIYVPLSFLHQVEYENELAAGLAYELSEVIHRHLALRLEKLTPKSEEGEQQPVPPILFGKDNVFDSSRDERKESIERATTLLYKAKFDARGLPSFFQHYAGYVSGSTNPDSELEKKEVEFNLREAHRVKASYLPLRDPVVRSQEFILMKKRLGS